MTFEQWLVMRGLSPSTAEKYAGAISGPLSDWATQSGLLNGPLTAMESSQKYGAVSTQLAQLPIFLERNERGHNMYSAALDRFGSYLKESFENDVEEDVAEVLLNPATTTTEKIELVKARIGQGKFREQLVAHWGCCAATGYNDISLLIASHIKPWRASNDVERLDPFNGLLLLPNLDRAFDKGLLTFNQEGLVQVSPLLSDPQQLGVLPEMRVKLHTEHQVYMDFHRKSVFRAL